MSSQYFKTGNFFEFGQKESKKMKIYVLEKTENTVSPRESGKQILEVHTFLLYFTVGSNTCKFYQVEK